MKKSGNTSLYYIIFFFMRIVTTPCVSTLHGLLVFSPFLAGGGLAACRLLLSRLTWAEELANLQSWESLGLPVPLTARTWCPGLVALFFFSLSTQHLHTLFSTPLDTHAHITDITDCSHFLDLFCKLLYLINGIIFDLQPCLFFVWTWSHFMTEYNYCFELHGTNM